MLVKDSGISAFGTWSETLFRCAETTGCLSLLGLSSVKESSSRLRRSKSGLLYEEVRSRPRRISRLAKFYKKSPASSGERSISLIVSHRNFFKNSLLNLQSLSLGPGK